MHDPGTIAVIDDTEGTRLATRRILERAGFNVIEGTCGADALRLARQRPDLMVLDVHMPDLLGPEVADRLKADPETRSIPILQLSASFTDESDRAFGLQSGADAYLTEPVEPELLLATVQALLRARTAERVAERALQTRDEFLSMTSHDIRGLLQALRLTLDVQLQRAQDRNFEREAMVHAIRRSVSDVQQMTRLVEDLLDRTQFDAGKVILHFQELDLSALVRQGLQRSIDEAGARGSAVELDAPEPVPGLFDPVRVDQVLSNLLSNAMAHGAGKPVRVSVRKSGAQAVISVTDHGPGIAAEDLEQVFQRFERGPSRERGGYGLGLWIVRELVQLHGGEVSVRSAPGQGATFEVRLPLHQKQER
ncbi:MAG TPA: hybrid sensor histidine kinase/response regulator [Myxococcales bacterium]|nr:hybrid sensor histidine kinase/response regulator [Myxococcales bacterium]